MTEVEDRAGRGGRPYLVLLSVAAVLGAVLAVYAQTAAFAWDEGFHLLAAQLIKTGKRPYADFIFAQPPLNAYWNALLLKLFGDTWRVPHAVAGLLSTGAAFLTADFVYTRFPVPRWRLAASIGAALSVGLNVAVVEFGTIGQAYGFCLFMSVAAFRLAVIAIERRRWLVPFAAGLFAGAANAGSLLSAPLSLVLLAWILIADRTGPRWTKGAAFVLGLVPPFAPLIALFIEAPRQTFFDVVRYHMFYRQVHWKQAGLNNLEVVTSWINSVQALLLILLGAAALWFLVRTCPWTPQRRAEFYLCAWLTVVMAGYLATPNPTFSRYFLLTVPYVSILAMAGLYAAAVRLDPAGGPARTVLVYCVLVSLGLAKTLYDGRDDFAWSDFDAAAAKVAEVAPPGSAIFADEQIYFLTRRQPPPGLEYDDSHKLTLTQAQASMLHVFPRKGN